MRRLLTILATAVLAVTLPSSATAAPDEPTPPRETGWYLALGDSLANGYLQGSGNHPAQGYAEHVLDAIKEDDATSKTKLVNLACSGETTTSMVRGGTCAYEQGSQLAEAVEFLHAHGRNTRLVTIDIGGNDIARCGFIGLPPSCTAAGLETLAANLPVILGQLRAAAGPDVQIVVLNYYDPFLAFWLLDTPGSTADDIYGDLALASVDVLQQVNARIAAAAAGADGDVADIATAFSTADWTTLVSLPGYGDVPLNVARICQWTTMCTHSDFHANPAGYAVMGAAVAGVLD